jgi:ABC-type bacteriocin/lantibiotic exporter with double-glycine peptidase domain
MGGMKIQRAPFLCGPLAVVNAARALGVHLTEREVRAHTGTTKKEGTNQWGILSALEKLGFRFIEVKADKLAAFELLRREIDDGAAAILSVEDGGHWAAAIGVIGQRIVTFDSWNSAANKSECGVDVVDGRQLLRWWTADNTGTHYAILVWRKETR